MGNAPANGNGNGTSNGHGPLRPPVVSLHDTKNPYRALSDLAGARVKTTESVYINARNLDDVLNTIKSLGFTGSLSVSFLNGKTAGEVEWRTSRKER